MSWKDDWNWQENADPGGFFPSSGSKKPDMPPMPDYIGAANAQSYGTIQAALANNFMAHPNVNTPLGSQTWKQIGTNKVNIPGFGDIEVPQYEQNVNMSPEQQNLYQQQLGIQNAQMGLQNKSMANVSNTLSQPMASSAEDIANTAYSAMTSRLDPQWDHREDQQKTQLANQGLAAGGEAYDHAMKDFNTGRNDAYQQAQLAAIQTMPQTMQMDTALRELPLQEYQALRTGSPVSMPQFQPSQYSMGAQGPNTLGATQSQGGWQQAMYNTQMGQYNNDRNSYMGLLGGLLGFL